jgi:hypothetical protein
MLIRGWRLNNKLKTTLPTHPQGKTFRLISFLVPVISRETLPLNGIAEFLVATRVATPEVTFTEFSKILPRFQFLQAGTHSSERPGL